MRGFFPFDKLRGRMTTLGAERVRWRSVFVAERGKLPQNQGVCGVGRNSGREKGLEEGGCTGQSPAQSRVLVGRVPDGYDGESSNPARFRRGDGAAAGVCAGDGT